MKKYFKFTSIALVIALMATLSACSTEQPDTATPPTNGEAVVPADPDNADGTATLLTTRSSSLPADTFVYNLSSVPNTLDPNLNNAVDGSIILYNVSEGLMRLDENDTPINGVAEKVDVSDDLLTYTFYLRKDAKWSDGEPVTADNFLYSWQRLLNPETAAEYAYLAFYIKGAQGINEDDAAPDTLGAKVIDANTLEVQLESSTPFFLSLMSFPAFFPIREDVITEFGDRWTLKPESYPTNGMYTFAEINDKQNILLKINENYWNKDVIKMKNIDMKLIEDENTSYAGYSAGNFDMIDKVPAAEITRGVEAGIAQILPYTGTYFLVMNLDLEKAGEINPEAAEAFQDVRVRKALSLAIDREEITILTNGGQMPAYSFVPDAITNSDGTSFAQTKYIEPKANLEEAKALLAEAGYPDGQGFPTFTYIYNSGAGHETVAAAIQSYWKQLGINVELKNSEWATLQTARDSKQYTMARHGWIADYNDASSFLEMFVTGVGQNNAGYSNPKFDKLLQDAKYESDLAKRDVLLHEAEDIFMEESVIIPVYFYTNVKGIAPYTTGVRSSVLGGVFFDQAEFK